jgi:hypothetical protein
MVVTSKFTAGLSALVIGTAVLDVTSASAVEYCVVCAEPAATYRCVIIDPKPGAAQSLQTACTGAVARDGKHSQCIIMRGVTVFQCDAVIKRVSIGDGSLQPVVVVPPPPPAPDPKEPPKTLLEAAKRAKDASDAQVQTQAEKAEAAGDATAQFFKKSFKCVGSLFTKCD